METCSCRDVVYDTQIYATGGRDQKDDDSDDNWDLGEAAHIMEDSEPPSESEDANDDAIDEEFDKSDSDAPMVVNKVAPVPAKKKSKKMKSAITGGSGQAWSDVSRGFISYLTKAKMPV